MSDVYTGILSIKSVPQSFTKHGGATQVNHETINFFLARRTAGFAVFSTSLPGSLLFEKKLKHVYPPVAPNKGVSLRRKQKKYPDYVKESMSTLYQNQININLGFNAIFSASDVHATVLAVVSVSVVQIFYKTRGFFYQTTWLYAVLDVITITDAIHYLFCASRRAPAFVGIM